MQSKDVKRKVKTPILDSLIYAGTIWIEGTEYVGKASDGVVVLIGTVGWEKDTERYLTQRPKPEQW